MTKVPPVNLKDMLNETVTNSHGRFSAYLKGFCKVSGVEYK